jgi:hypothetical protein
MQLTFEQWPGTLGPVTGTPDRRRGSIRRTTSIRTTWPDGFDSSLLLTAVGRDVVTTGEGDGVVTDRLRLEVRAEGPLKTVRSITSDPAGAELHRLEGLSLAGGFRKGVAMKLAPGKLAPGKLAPGKLAPGKLGPGEGSVLALLLDDLPGAALVSGSARLRAVIEATGELPGFGDAELPVVCIGRRPDGVMTRSRREGHPLLGQGPPCGELARPDDPLAWPAEPPLPVHGMRRLRRVDVSVVEDRIVVDTHFRDSYMESSGVESSVHEYEVFVSAGAGDHVIRAIEVRPRVLPGPDCPGATASARAVVGQPMDELRRFVRTAMRDDTICTHLNDQLRSLADVPALLSVLP